MTSAERKAEALERHRISGLQKGESIAIAAVRRMCAGGGNVIFSASKVRQVEGVEERGVPRMLLVTAHRLLALELSADADVAAGKGHADVKSNHHLTELQKLTFTKKDPTLVKLFYKRMQGSGDEAKRAYKTNMYRMQQARKFIGALTSRLRALRA